MRYITAMTSLNKTKQSTTKNSTTAITSMSDDSHILAWSVFNRDLMQLEFFNRVLEEAQNPSIPLLERLKFLAVLDSNLDEFFMVRVSGLKEMLQLSNLTPTPGDLPPR